jgi:hypothetical protein
MAHFRTINGRNAVCHAIATTGVFMTCFDDNAFQLKKYISMDDAFGLKKMLVWMMLLD